MLSSPIAKMRGTGWRPRIIRFQKYRVNGIVPVHAAATATRTSSWTLAVVLGSFHIVLLNAANNSKAIKGHAVVALPIIIFLFFIGFMTEQCLLAELQVVFARRKLPPCGCDVRRGWRGCQTEDMRLSPGGGTAGPATLRGEGANFATHGARPWGAQDRDEGAPAPNSLRTFLRATGR